MDHQPGHLFRRPGVEEYIAYKPVHEEEAETCRLYKAADDANQAKYQTYLLVQGNKQQVVVPGLTTTCTWRLLNPGVNPRTDAIAKTAINVGEEDSKQDQEYRPGAQNREELVLPWYGKNGIQHALLFWINRKSTRLNSSLVS